MKKIVTFCLLSLALWAACRPQQPEPPLKEEPVVNAPDTFAIGDGVEIYRALLDWQSGSRLSRYFTTGTVLNEKPLIRYNDIKRYYKFAQIGGNGTFQIGIKTNKVIYTAFGLPPSPIFGKAYYVPQEASDTGFVVTLDKQPIYFAYHRSSQFPNIQERNLAFVPAQDRDSLNKLMPNVIRVIWDSIYYPYTTPRPEPDPRFDKRLLERLKKDGKLGF